MKQGQHFGYPRTPHIQGSAVVDDDESVSSHACLSLLQRAGTIAIQEKVDGTNVSVHFETEWIPIYQKRSGLILQGEHEQYVRFRDWCNENLEDLNRVLGTRYILFGEWLLCTHGVTYDALPSFFLAFDVFDKHEEKFLSVARMKAVLDGVVECVPVLATDWDGSVKALEKLVSKSQFSTSETAEGVYIRFESADGFVTSRLKYRRKSFKAGRSDFNTVTMYNSVANS